MARFDSSSSGQQAQLFDTRFQAPGSDAGEADETPSVGTPAFAEQMDTPIGQVDDGETREALLNAPFGATVIIAGRGYTIGRQHTEPIRQVLSAPLLRVLELDTAFAVLDNSLVRQSAANDDGTVPEDAKIPLEAVQVDDDVEPALADRLEETPAAVTTDRDCPECGPEATTSFDSDDVDNSYKGARSIPDNPVAEVRYCHECESTFTRVSEIEPDTATVEQTRGLYGITDEPVEIGGLYVQHETCLFPMMRETNAYCGLWTASEVAKFVNGKLDDSGEDSELFGFVSVQDDGEVVEWHDDQPYNMEVTFRRVDAEVIATRGSDGNGNGDGTEVNQAVTPAPEDAAFDIMDTDSAVLSLESSVLTGPR